MVLQEGVKSFLENILVIYKKGLAERKSENISVLNNYGFKRKQVHILPHILQVKVCVCREMNTFPYVYFKG